MDRGIEDIRIVCLNGIIMAEWSWKTEDIQKVEIAYKRQDIEGGDGTRFIENEILRMPGKWTGTAERHLNGEEGLYTFSFLLYGTDGKEKDKIRVCDVALGCRRDISWRWKSVREGNVIVFSVKDGVVMEDAVYVEYEGMMYSVGKKLVEGSRLLFLAEVKKERVKVCLRQAYRNLYRLHRM